MDDQEMAIRLGVACLGGLLLGLDREIRGVSAGIRTHALVAISSALITVSALLLYEQMRHQGGSSMDPLRVIQGLAQAIGFIAAGTIFVAKGDVRNLTSAANVWLAAAIGIAAGAGQYSLTAMGIIAGLIILVAVRLVERYIPGSDKHEGQSGAKSEQP